MAALPETQTQSNVDEAFGAESGVSDSENEYDMRTGLGDDEEPTRTPLKRSRDHSDDDEDDLTDIHGASRPPSSKTRRL